MRYQTFVNVLDTIRLEAPDHQANRYRPDNLDKEKVNQARARAFIHLYLKVMFGVIDFSEREKTITDGSGDGGIDGYFIDSEIKTIYIIQSKFRINEKNFETKEIEVEEILAMDINRILEGESTDEHGVAYNGKIKQLQREITQIGDIARFNYRVCILANLRGVSASNIRKLTDGYTAEVFDFEKTYEKLVFPVITGTYFTANDIVIPIDLSNKNSGSKISYNVKTRFGDCEITVLFVPTLEIAKLMRKYKNSILKYNPRSYLDLEGQSVNSAIRDTILQTKTNEFALLNNGLTMLSEETNINERIGQKNKAQLRIKNPQIINGGQTSFTLSRLYSEHLEDADDIFADKEVLLKIITLLDNNSGAAKLELIDEISNATNKQTPVINADRFANEIFHSDLQRHVFQQFGLLYERKRGEFSDGIKDGYILASDIIERNQFWRLCYTATGKIDRGFQKKLFQRNDFSDIDPKSDELLEKVCVAKEVFKLIKAGMKPQQRVEKQVYAKVFAYIEMFFDPGQPSDPLHIRSNFSALEKIWEKFSSEQREKYKSTKAYVDRITGEPKLVTSLNHVLRRGGLEKELKEFLAKEKEAQDWRNEKPAS